MKGAHGLRPDGHEHVRCRYCLAEAVHVHTIEGSGVLGRPDDVLYAAHSRHGTEVPCDRSVRQVVDLIDRHRPAPEDTP